MAYGVLIILVVILLVAAVSKRIRGTIFTLPMIYTLFGLLIAVLFSDLLSLEYDNPVVELVAELTLVLVLASDSSRIKLKDLRSHYGLPIRILLIALPLMIVTGALAGGIIFEGLNIWVLAILAVTLAPIDSSLAESSVSDPKLPSRIRRTLSVEGGLDDGIALPFLLLFISLAISSETGIQEGRFLIPAAAEIALGILAGAILGYLGARYISWGNKSSWMSSHFQKISWLALVLLTFGVAEAIGGNGFVASFAFGIISGNAFKAQTGQGVHRFAEVEKTLLMMLTFVFFGAVMLYPLLEHIDLEIIIYAILSLTLVRMLPVAISLIGTKLRLESMLYLGWFGPRGLVSILYAYIVVDAEDLAQGGLIIRVIIITIFISVLVHGISAVPLTNWYAKRISQIRNDSVA